MEEFLRKKKRFNMDEIVELEILKFLPHKSSNPKSIMTGKKNS